MGSTPRLVAFALCVLCTTAEATTLLAFDVSELVRRSDAIVVGKVLRSESRWSGDGRLIFTESEVEVREVVKGGPATLVRVQELGGVVDGLEQRVQGMASFSPGEEVLLFLQPRGMRHFHLVGMAQGKYRLEKPEAGKGRLAYPSPLGQAHLVHPLTREPVESPKRAPVTLEQVRGLVRQGLKSPVVPR